MFMGRGGRANFLLNNPTGSNIRMKREPEIVTLKGGAPSGRDL